MTSLRFKEWSRSIEKAAQQLDKDPGTDSTKSRQLLQRIESTIRFEGASKTLSYVSLTTKELLAKHACSSFILSYVQALCDSEKFTVDDMLSNVPTTTLSRFMELNTHRNPLRPYIEKELTKRTSQPNTAN